MNHINMENKTISQINSKTWYRLLKVIYIFVGIIALVIFNGVAIFDSPGYGALSTTETTVLCTMKDKKELILENIPGVYLSKDDFPAQKFDYKRLFSGGNVFDVKAILEACYGDSGMIFNDSIIDEQKRAELTQKHGLIGKTKTTEEIQTLNLEFKVYKLKEEKLYSDSDKIKLLDFSIKLFDIQPVFDNRPLINFLVFGNLVILAIFEIGRRIFYYIVLGKLKPKG